MLLTDRLTTDMKEALKAKNNATLSTLRFLLAAVKNKKIDVQHELSDAEVQDVIKMQVKQLKDSIVSFESGGRVEMVASARAEIEVLMRYLPEQMTDEALETFVREAIVQTNATSKADMGKVIGAAVKAAEGKADGGRIKEIVAKLLPMIALAFVAVDSATAKSLPLMSEADLGQNGGYIETMLRIVRVMVLWFGIGAITLIINGAFQYMTASYRDDAHHSAMHKITEGVFVTIIVATIFAVSTVYLQKM